MPNFVTECEVARLAKIIAKEEIAKANLAPAESTPVESTYGIYEVKKSDLIFDTVQQTYSESEEVVTVKYHKLFKFSQNVLNKDEFILKSSLMHELYEEVYAYGSSEEFAQEVEEFNATHENARLQNNVTKVITQQVGYFDSLLTEDLHFKLYNNGGKSAYIALMFDINDIPPGVLQIIMLVDESGVFRLMFAPATLDSVVNESDAPIPDDLEGNQQQGGGNGGK